MSEFHLFPQLSLELRLLIWSHVFLPSRLISLEAEGYGEDEDPTALPFYTILGLQHRPQDNGQVARKMWSGRFVPAQIPSGAAFQVSRESRSHAFFLGYRIWKMQKPGGLVRSVIWNPATDFVVFPRRLFDEQLELGKPFVHPHAWLRMFRAQFPAESSIVQNVAIHTSLWYRGKLQHRWVVDQLLQLRAMQNLTMIVDVNFERSKVQGLVDSNISEDQFGSWRLPYAVVETLEGIKHSEPSLRMRKIPEVRLVESVSDILTSSGLEVTLRCNPCVYLQMSEIGERTA